MHERVPEMPCEVRSGRTAALRKDPAQRFPLVLQQWEGTILYLG